jgi:hypothetical protein
MASLEQGEQRRAHMLSDTRRKLIRRSRCPPSSACRWGAIYNMADTFFVGKLGNSATGAVGIVFPIMNLLQRFLYVRARPDELCVTPAGQGGCTERLAHGQHGGYQRAAAWALSNGAVGILFLHPLALVPSPQRPPYCPTRASTRCIFTSRRPLFAASYVFNNTLRAEGSAVLALVGMSSGAVLNIILDPICIFALTWAWRARASPP